MSKKQIRKSVLQKSVVIEPHARIKNKNVTITTLSKTNRTKMTPNEIKMIGEALLRNAKPNSKIMIKVLSNKGFFQIKGYTDGFDVILDENDYINGKEGVEAYTMYKASFYII